SHPRQNAGHSHREARPDVPEANGRSEPRARGPTDEPARATHSRQVIPDGFFRHRRHRPRPTPEQRCDPRPRELTRARVAACCGGCPTFRDQLGWRYRRSRRSAAEPTVDTVIRVGVLTPHEVPGPEVEFAAMAPGRLAMRVVRTT